MNHSNPINKLHNFSMGYFNKNYLYVKLSFTSQLSFLTLQQEHS